MLKDLKPSNTVRAWLIVKGTWPNRLDLACESNEQKALKRFSVMMKGNPGIRLEPAHLVEINGQWHRVNVNPVLCEVNIDSGILAATKTKLFDKVMGLINDVRH